MDAINKIRQSGWPGNEELICSVLCMGIAASLIFWPLLNSILCITLFGYWLLFSKKKFSLKSSQSRWIILFGSLFLMSMVGIVYSNEVGEGFAELQKKSALLLFPLIFGMSAIITPVVFKRTLAAFTLSTALGCLICIINGVYILLKNGTTDYLYGYNLVVLKNMQPFLLGLCCLLSLLHLLNKLVQCRANGETFKKADIPVAIFLFIFLFLLGNRNVLIAMSGFFIFYSYKLILRTVNRLLLISLLGFLFIFAVCVNPYLHNQWNDLTDFSKENNIQLDSGETLGRAWGGKTIRLTIWKCSQDIIKRHWIAGVGTGDAQAALQEAYEKRKFYFASRYNTYNAHNQYIQETVAHGIIGLLIFLACICMPFLMCLREKGNTLYALFILCFALLCVTESMLELNKGIIWYSFFNSFFMFRKKLNA